MPITVASTVEAGDHAVTSLLSATLKETQEDGTGPDRRMQSGGVVLVGLRIKASTEEGNLALLTPP